MKHLPIAPLTVEDHAAWVEVCCLWHGTPQPMSAAGRADRRDAELMLTAQRMRGFGFTDRIAVPSLMELGWHAVGGQLS